MLDPYSQKQGTKLAELRPDWVRFFGEHSYAGGGDSYFLVTIPSSGDPTLNLFLDTSNDEVTISFGMWEWHYPNPSEPDGDELELALAEIDRIQNEEYLVASYWHYGTWLGTRIIDQSDPLTIPGFAGEATVIKVLSWSGRLNREVAL